MSSRKITLEDVVNIPYGQVIDAIVEFIRENVEKAGVERVVLGLSGGVDSSTVFKLLLRAVGRENVVVLIMPDTRVNVKRDLEDSLELAREYGVEHYYIPINDIVNSYKILPFFNYNDRIATGNLRARIRMNILYYYANRFNALVAGTSDRSEILIGYYTKYGDGGVDILPIGSLYKTQVRRLAAKLGLPEKIVKKPSSPGLWEGHLAEEELGLRYEDIDLVLYSIVDRGIKPEDVPKYTGIHPRVVEKIVGMHRRSRHKRRLPPTPRFSWLEKPIIEF